MALFPRKYRSLLYKLVVIIPVLWLTVMLIAHNSNSGSGGGSNNVLPDASGSGGAMPGGGRNILDGEASGIRDTGNLVEIENKDAVQDRTKKPSPSRKPADVEDRYAF